MFSTKKEEKSPEEERRTSVVPEIRILAPSLERGLDDSSHKYPSKDDTDSIKDISEIEEDFYTQDHSLFIEFISSLWFALISNTDLVCYLLVFIHMVASASVLALPIPVMVFLWGTLSVPRPSKTFWVTIIAYTQIVVLVKCVCQFDFFWSATNIRSNNPLAIPRIFGFEQKTNYATYDLALLMVVFFHRFIQKQMGIWRSTTDDDDDKEFANRGSKVIVQSAVVQQGCLTLALPGPNQHDNNADDERLVSGIDEGDEGAAPGEYKYLPKKALVSTKKYCSSCTNFFQKLLTQTNRVTADVYVYIFLCDFTNFFVLLFGFTAFGSSQGDGGVAAYLEENKIPVAFLIMLLLQFVFIIVDRALYLRKNLVGKIVFQFISVIGMHIWLFFLVPALSEKSFNAKAPPVVYYLFKCCYFLLSAYQIRCGYPRRILGNCLTKGFSIFNLGAFKVYMLTPFLFELRALMDWIWTDTTMPLFEWLRMEDIFANIYEIKCSRQMEEDFPAPRGVAKRPLTKYIMGGAFLLAIIALIWGPLALFALGNTVGEKNVPTEVSVELQIGPYEPIYRMSAQSSKIFPFSSNDLDDLTLKYKHNKIALTFLSNYENVDIAAVTLGSNSTALWIISPPDLARLIEDLRTNTTLNVRYKYSVSRKTYSEKMPGTISMEPTYVIEEDDRISRDALIGMLTNNVTERLTLPFLLPKFIKVKNLGEELQSISQLMSNKSIEEIDEMVFTDDNSFRNISLQMHTSDSVTWWEVLENCNDSDYLTLFAKLPYADCQQNLVVYTFSDKLFPKTLSIFTAGGVIGIYTSLVFIASRLFRSMFSGGSTNIMYSELPFVDRILQLCLDIYLVRESMEFSLEEDLFAKLIFLYRSPETMIKWTRPADEQSNDDDTENSESSENKEELEVEAKKNQ